MKRILVIGLVMFGVACATSDPPLPPVTKTAVPDPELAELRTSLTELLERIDVLNHRIGRLEEARVEPMPRVEPIAAPPASSASPAAATPQRPVQRAPQPLPPLRATETPRQAEAEHPALAAARIADEYRQAIITFGQGRHAESRQGFERVFSADPSGDLADNALFWIGETHYANREYTAAIRFYTRVVNEYPEQNKAPDAFFKMALAIERTGDLALARQTFQQLIERYPYSTPASSAKKELQRIRY